VTASAGMTASERRGVAAFDFDGTLVAGDSFIAFLARVVGWPRLAALVARHAPALADGYRAGGRDRTKAVLLSRVLLGTPVPHAQALGERYGLELLGRVRPEMSRTIAWHRARHHRLVLVSASLALYLEPFGRAAGFDQVIATRLGTTADDQLSGQLDGANVRGPEKARLLHAALGDGPFELWAYGDSAGDREMLGMADHPTWVGRRSKRGGDPRD
jgi:phosphatidylglycerophosphatase C